MEDLIPILVLSGIGLVTLLVSVWLFYRKKRKTAEKKSACTAECRAAIVDAVNYHVKSKYRLAKAAGAVSVAHLLSGAGGSVGKTASLGVKTAMLGLYYYPVYRYTYRGETYEQIGDVPAMEEQARKKGGNGAYTFYRSGQTYQLLLPGGGRGLLSAAPCLPDRRSSRHCGFDYDWSHVANNIASVPAAAKPAAGGFPKKDWCGRKGRRHV